MAKGWRGESARHSAARRSGSAGGKSKWRKVSDYKDSPESRGRFFVGEWKKELKKRDTDWEAVRYYRLEANKNFREARSRHALVPRRLNGS